jgi:two-component system chemotaxis response regulator CheB
VGVVLTGELDDGTAGLWSIKFRGGTTIVQDPMEAEHPSMPRSAKDNVKIDHCLTLREIAPLLVRLAKDSVEDDVGQQMSEKLDIENRIALDDPKALTKIATLGTLTSFTCPSCHGSLWELREGDFVRFRCRTGHAYSAEALMAEQMQGIENTLGDALRSIGENEALVHYFRQHTQEPQDQKYFSNLARLAKQRQSFIEGALGDIVSHKAT